jgi:hypothetical protein
MATKEYDTDTAVTMASEPSVAYVSNMPDTQRVGREGSVRLSKPLDKRNASSDVLPGCVSFEEFKEALMKSVVSYYE